MKSYTDIEQSKKLAEILPIESADMYRVFENNAETRVYYGNAPTAYFVCKPCWSLITLFSALPTIDDKFEPQLHRSLDKYRCTYEGEEDSSGLWRVADNPVDACYKMILMLHKLNLL